jgi:hypothetical protein
MQKAVNNPGMPLVIEIDSVAVGAPVYWDTVPALPANAHVTIKPAAGSSSASFTGATGYALTAAATLELRNVDIDADHGYSASDAGATLVFTGCKLRRTVSVFGPLVAATNGAKLTATGSSFTDAVNSATGRSSVESGSRTAVALNLRDWAAAAAAPSLASGQLQPW